jgi:hypothetical protein
MIQRKFFLFVFLFAALCSFAQKEWDTTKYIKYKDRLVVAAFVSYRFFDWDIKPNNANDSGKTDLHYLARANNITGLEFNYDKISFSFGIKSTPQTDSTKGKTSFKNFTVGVGGNQWILDLSFRNYKGFYDDNTFRYDTSFHPGSQYYQNASMQVKQYKGKFLYFTNAKKFSYKSSYSDTYRQLRSAFSWVLSGNVYSNQSRADTSFIPYFVRDSFRNDAYLNKLNVNGISAGAGASFNLVIWKRFFGNLTFVLNCEPQWRTYGRYYGPTTRMTSVSASGDARFAIGFNSRNFFLTFNGNADFVYINNSNIQITSKFISGAFNIGYRFKVKTPGFYKKIQETKIYKML